jgi:uncharacterized heparinase superfamily protein
MSLTRWLTLARKATRRPPRFVLRRAAEELRRQAYRPWGRIRPWLLTDRALLALTRARSIDDLWERLIRRPSLGTADDRQAWTSFFAARWPDQAREIRREADRLLRHEFDLLGSGPVSLGERLPWHDDFKAGRRWPLRYAPDIDFNELERSSDVKVPWELSRCQHFARLGQAYWLTGDERYAEEFTRQIADWIDANPWTRGVNWVCTMDVALRAVSWTSALRYFARSSSCGSRRFRSLFLRSLYLHGEFIASHLEISELNGNHYLVDGVGLALVALFFHDAPAARDWLAAGSRIVFDEIGSQVCADGVDFEQSTAYHRLVLEAFLTAYVHLRQAGRDVPAAAWSRLERMMEFVAAYTKPNGLAPLIGDADDGRIQKLGVQALNDHRYLLSTGAVLFGRGDFKRAAGRFWDESFWLLGPEGAAAFDALADAGGDASAAFRDGGFYIMRASDAHLIIDCAEVGMRGRGGHGHNDILSFELFLNGMNVVTDCGSYLYTASREWRNRFRSTAFHNTVQVDGEELNRFIDADEIWRLHDDARPTAVTWRTSDVGVFFRGGHTGYRRLASPVMHVREVLFDRSGRRVTFRDILEGRGRHHLVWRFHLDPSVTADVQPAGIRLRGPAAEVWFRLGADAAIDARIEPGWVSPGYGRKVEASILILECTCELPKTIVYCFSDVAPAADEINQAVARMIPA